MDWAQVLVIILAAFLALFLALAVALTVMLIRLTQQIRGIAASAQRTVEQFEQASENMTRMSMPMFFIRKIMGRMKKKH